MVSTPSFTDGTWKVAATGDITSDGNGDILWQNIADQSLILWQQDGATTTNTWTLASETGYTVAASGDLDGDGKTDYLMEQDTGGDRKVLLGSDGAIRTFGSVGADWQVRATTDVNADGKDDVAWFNTGTADIAIWTMDGATITGGLSFASGYATDDMLHAVFNGTATNSFDSLWYDNSANSYDITSYDAGGRTITETFTVNAGNNYVSSGDYNGDGDLDFFFRDDDGSDVGSIEIVYTNEFNETARLTYEAPTFQGLAFEVGGDFDGDGKSEVIGRDTVSGETTVYNAVGGSSSSQTIIGSDGEDLIDGQDGNDRIFAGDGDDVIVDSGTTTTNSETVFGGGGDDRIDTGIEDDQAHGGTGDDTLQGVAGDDVLSGGAGDDLIRTGNGTDYAMGGDGDDYILGGSFGYDHVQGNDGDDVIQGVGARMTAEGGDGDDKMFGSSSLDVLFGGAGDDYIEGGLSQDTLYGGSGNDILIGVDRAGTSGTDDTMYGGTGSDYFYLGNDDGNYYVGVGKAYIMDFSTSATSGDWLMLNGTSSDYDFVDTGATIEVRQSSDADVLAVIETTSSAAAVEAKALYIG